MAKLSKKITTNQNNNNNNSNQENKKLGFSLSTKKENEKENEQTDSTQENTEKNITFEIPEDNESLKKMIFEKLHLSNKNYISDEKITELFNSESKPISTQLSELFVNSFFDEKTLNEIRKIITEINSKISNQKLNIEELNSKIKKQEILIQNLTAQVEDAEELTFKTEKKYSDAIAIEEIIKSFITENQRNQYTEKIESLLLDSFKNGGKTGKKFTIEFLKGYIWISEAIISLGEDEKTNVEQTHIATKKFLEQISGENSAERRPLLDIIANMLNTHFNEYDFISPEQTLLIDPSIHNAEGTGGTSIKEGLSYAVVRRETRKTVLYADIIIK